MGKEKKMTQARVSAFTRIDILQNNCQNLKLPKKKIKKTNINMLTVNLAYREVVTVFKTDVSVIYYSFLFTRMNGLFD